MKFKELFNKISQPSANLGTGRFRLTMDKESFKTPHFVMNKVREMMDSKPRLANGLRQITRFVVNDVKFESDDPKSIKFMEEWWKLRKLDRELFNFTLLWLGGGTAYLEPIRVKDTNGVAVIDSYVNHPDPSVIYKNLESNPASDEFWIMEVPYEVRAFAGKTAKYFQVYYLRGETFYRNNVWGIGYPESKYMQYTFGCSRTRDYGQGLLSSAVDNEDVADEILKNWALSAKFRSLGKKIIGFYNESGETVDPSEIDRIQEEFASLEEEDNLIVNKKFVSEDIGFSNTDNLMDTQMEYIHKDSGSSLTPNYMTGFSQDSSLATAAEAKVPFELEITAIQRELETFLNLVIMDEMKKQFSFLDKDLTIVLPTPNLYSRTENFMNILQMYQISAATYNELRSSAGLSESVDGGDELGKSPEGVEAEPEDTTPVRESAARKEALVLKAISVTTPNITFKTAEETKTTKKENLDTAIKDFIGR